MVTFTQKQVAGETPERQPFKGLRDQVLGQPQVKLPEVEQPWIGLKDQVTGKANRFDLSAKTAFEKEDPERSARIIKVADKVRLPIDFVERNLEKLEKDSERQGFNAKEYRQKNPVVSEWLSENPHYFSAAKDDLTILEQAENIAKGMGERISSLAGGLTQLAQLPAGRGAPPLVSGVDTFEQLASRTPGGESVAQAASRMSPTEEQVKGLQQLITEAADRVADTEIGYEEYTSWDDFKQSPLSNFIPFALEQGLVSVPDMAAAIISLPTYVASRTGEIARNRAQMDFREAPTTGDFLAALPASTTDALLERLSAKYLIGLDGPVGSVTQLPGRVAGAAAREGATEAIQESVEQTATTLGTERGFDIGETLEAAAAGAVGGAGFGGIARGVTAPTQLAIERAKGNQRKRFFNALGENAENSKLRERVPEKYREVFDRLTKDGPVETMFIPEEAHTEYWQSQGRDPREAAQEIFGDASYYDNASSNGGMIEVPTAVYAERVAADADLNAFYQNNSTFDPTEMTVAEFERAQQEAENIEVTEEIDNAESVTAEQRIYQDLYGQLQQTTSREVADSQARYVATVFRTLGNRSGIDPFELYQSRGLQVRRNVPETLRQPTQLTNVDYILNAVRDDSLPTEQEIYGPRFIDIMREQGISEEGGELDARDVDANQTGRNRMIRKSGKWTLDDAAERAFELGLIEANDQDQLLDLVDRELSGERVVIEDQFNAQLASQREYADSLMEYLDSIDVDINDLTNQQVAAIISGEAQASDFTDQETVLESQTVFEQSNVQKNQIDLLQQQLAQDGVNVRLSFKPSLRELEIMNIAVSADSRNQGLASQAMGKITDFADTNGLTITLDPEPQDKTTTKRRLKDLYKRFNFVENKGSNRDYTISRDMYREPKQVREQKDGDTPRGTIKFGPETGFNREFTITLNDNADLSTFLHESGHLFLETMFDLAELDSSPQQIKDDVAAILEKMGVDSRDKVEARHHEMFAEWHEMYLREGKAPTEELRSLFATFWSWLIRVYKSMKDIGITGTKLNDEVRGIMDRIVATDAEIEAASSETQRLYESFAESGMSEEEWQQYIDEVSASITEAREQVTTKVMREQQRAKKQWYRNEREKVRREIEKDVNQMRVYRALDVLQRGKAPDGQDLPPGVNPTKLSKQGIIDLRGEEYLKKLPRPYVYTKEGGVSPQMFAQQMGYEDAESMLNDIEGAVKKSDYINILTDEEMRQRHGDILLDGEIPAEALAALHNDRRVGVLKQEIKSLSRRTGKRAAPIDLIRGQAQRIISQRKVKDIKPNVYRMAERKASRSAFRAATENNYEEAFKQKQKEILNHELWKQARDAREFEDRVSRHMRKLSKKSAQQRIGKAGADYLEQINGILDTYEFKRQSNKELQRRQSLRAWMREKEQNGETLGDEFNVPDEVVERSQRVNYRELPLQELRGVFDMVRQIEHFARTKNKLLQEKAKRDKDEARQELISALEANITNRGKPPLTKNAMKLREKMTSKARSFDASLLKMEQMIEWLDGGEIDGPWHRLLWDGAVEAQALEQDYTESVTKKIAEAVENIPKEVRKNMLNHTGIVAGRRMVRKDVIGVALNVGNKSNYDKLLKGMGWSESDVDAMLSLLTKEEWDFVQSVWNTLEELWPEIAKLEKDITGLEPGKIEPRKVETKYGTYNGGYYPVMYDPNYSEQGELQLSANIGDMLEKGYTRATTPKGHTKERVEGYARPFNLDVDFLTLHTAGVIKDLTHRKWLIDANWIVNDPKIREVVNETLGPEYQGFFKDWVKNVANDRNASNLQTLGVWKRMFEQLRLNMMIATMGFKATTLISQFAGIGPSIEVVGGKEGDGVKWIAKAAGQLMLKPNEIGDIWDMVKTKSPEMRFRLQNKDRDIRSALRNVQGKEDWLSQIQEISLQGIGYADLMVTLPTWLAGYNKAQSQGLTEEQSIKAGDKAVRLSQGSGGAKDLAAVASRNDTLMRLLTMYYTPFSAMHNRLRNVGHEFGGIKDVPKAFASVFWLALVPATLGELLVGRGPEDDEEWSEWMVTTNLSYLTLGMPFVRDMVSATVSEFGYTFTPIAQVGKKTANVGRDLTEVISGDKPKDEAIVDLAKATFAASGYWLGIPTSQLEITGGYMHDLATGDDDTENFVEKIMYRREED